MMSKMRMILITIMRTYYMVWGGVVGLGEWGEDVGCECEVCEVCGVG